MDKKSKRAYIAWEDNDVSSDSDSDHEEQAHLSLMASHHSDDENEVSDADLDNPSFLELQDAFIELHKESLRLSKLCSKQKIIIESLESQNYFFKKEVVHLKDKFNKESITCLNCETLNTKLHSLNKELEVFKKSSHKLDNILHNQRHTHDKRGLGYSYSHKTNGMKQPLFVKATRSNLHDYKVSKSCASISQQRIKQPTCFYCICIGHTPNTCFIRNQLENIYGLKSVLTLKDPI